MGPPWVSLRLHLEDAASAVNSVLSFVTSRAQWIRWGPVRGGARDILTELEKVER